MASTIPEDLTAWEFTDRDRALWGDAANIGDSLIDCSNDFDASRHGSASRAAVVSGTNWPRNDIDGGETSNWTETNEFSEKALFLQRFRRLTQGRGDSSIQDPLDFESVIANGIVPPSTFASETERFEWARLEIDTEALRPMIKSPEEIELEKELSRREMLKARPRPERYLEHLLQTSKRGSMDETDLQRYERFRRSLAKLLRRGIKQHMVDKGIDPEPSPNFSLCCIGSLRYGQALQPSEMDLLFSPRSLPDEMQQDIVDLTQRLLMEQGLAVIRTVCWDPSIPVLKVANSDAYNGRIRNHMRESINHAVPFFNPNLAAEIFETPTSAYRCNIFFPNNPLMEHTANILQCYSLCDPRVKKMGHFIKKWVRARNISNPRQGTLSGTGYLYLLIHYLRDVADPPVLPNLQTCNYGRRELEYIDGQEIHYWSNKEEISAARDAGKLTQNTESVNALLRGFFEYYCGKAPEAQCTARRKYFHWKEYSLILRSDGGSVLRDPYPSWEKSHSGSPHHHDAVRIQDAMDTRRNIGASVTMDGSQRMRNEFARARLYIEHAVVIPGTGWGWQKHDGSVGEQFFEPVLYVAPPPMSGSSDPARSKPSDFTRF